MSEKTKVDFTTHAGAPLVVEVVGADGRQYEMLISLAIFSVFDTGTTQPAMPGSSDIVPMFEIQAQVATVTRRKPS